MGHAKKTILITILIFIFGLCSTKPAVADEKGRVLHFPKDRSLGMIKFMGPKTGGYQESFNDWYWKAEYICEARGDVNVPADKIVGLFLYKSAFADLSPLSKLRPDDIGVLFVLGNHDDETLLSEKSMGHITHLTGLKVLCLATQTRATTNILKQITKLRSLEYFSPPSARS